VACRAVGHFTVPLDGRRVSRGQRRLNANSKPEREDGCTVPISVNGSVHELPTDPRVSLLDYLRDRLDLPGAKKGCDQGACGACTVLVDGRRILACLALAVQYAGCAVTTIEGLAAERSLASE
jgi:xanthine dehydrogenase iron-sulfur cluster and FAD-binding subunit A